MKKVYSLFFALGLGIVVNAQSYDLTVTLDNFANGDPSSDDPLEMDFTVVNTGATTIPTGDSVFFQLSVDTDVYSTIDLTPDYTIYVKLTSDLAQTQGFAIDVASMDMAWLYDNGGLNSTVCITLLGVNVQAATPPTMLNLTDDFSCVDYTVTSVAGLEGVGMSYFNVYPNPANEVVNFQVGNNEVSHINVFDMTGKLVSTILVNDNVETVNTDEIGTGMFFYQMMNGEEMVKTDKFVVTK
ncbi:MAG: T9SS type A sorting domain-containing protein [Crocinitomicaceae bacterium]|nr:T9SS type A sorting domain-containing protein [Crocinitomicaceae bacterium]